MRLLARPSLPPHHVRRSHRRVAIVALALATGCAPTFLERAASEPGATHLPSGAVMRTLRAGDGPNPRPDDRVQVAYEGRLVDGKVFASSKERGSLEVGVGDASPCWRDALVRMRVGEKVRLTCTSDMARGGEGPTVPEDTSVTFDLELLGAAGTAGEVLLPPGLGYKVLRPGTGERPRPSDTVKVDYEGHLDDGTVFDSSIKRGEPATFPLAAVIPCWRYALQKMHVGEKAELVCPPDLAYGAKGSPPSIPPNARLTFQVELLSIEHAQ